MISSKQKDIFLYKHRCIYTAKSESCHTIPSSKGEAKSNLLTHLNLIFKLSAKTGHFFHIALHLHNCSEKFLIITNIFKIRPCPTACTVLDIYALDITLASEVSNCACLQLNGQLHCKLKLAYILRCPEFAVN